MPLGIAEHGGRDGVADIDFSPCRLPVSSGIEKPGDPVVELHSRLPWLSHPPGVPRDRRGRIGDGGDKQGRWGFSRFAPELGLGEARKRDGNKESDAVGNGLVVEVVGGVVQGRARALPRLT